MKAFWKSALAGAVCLTVAAGALSVTAFAEEHVLDAPKAYDDWADAYTDVLNARREEYPYFSLRYIDDDDIPELILHHSQGYSAHADADLELYTFYDGMLYDLGAHSYDGYNCFTYDPEQHAVIDGWMQMGYENFTVAVLSQGKLSTTKLLEVVPTEDGEGESITVNGVVYTDKVEAYDFASEGLNAVEEDYGDYENTPENIALYLQITYTGWRDAYAEVLRLQRGKYNYFSLRYIDGDDIPELILHADQGDQHPHAVGDINVYSFYDGQLYVAEDMCDDGYNTFTYEEKTGYIRVSWVGQGYYYADIYKLSEGTMELMHVLSTEGTMENPEYYVDGEYYDDLDEALAAAEFHSHDWTEEFGDYENTDANIKLYLSEPNQPTNPNPNPTPNPNNTTNNNTTNNNTNAVKTGDTGLAPLAMLIPAGLLAFAARKRKHDDEV